MNANFPKKSFDRAELRKEYGQLRHELDDLRQRDNHILFELGNPPERDADRAQILQQMREVIGKMQNIEYVLREDGSENV